MFLVVLEMYSTMSFLLFKYVKSELVFIPSIVFRFSPYIERVLTLTVG